MKKFIISLAVLGIFLIYAASIRHQSPLIKKPTILSTNNPAPTNSAVNTNNTTNTTNNSTNASNSTPTAQYKDGTHTGSIADAFYGNVQVSVTISGGKITNVNFLQYPNTHSTSVAINQQAIPFLQQEAIQAQSANVQIVSGATFTSQAFIQSLTAALSQA
jgi:uncharacterized protein with FMN-binding domain